MKAFVHCGGAETLALKGALLLYESRSRAFGVWHEGMLGSGEAPQLGAAQALSAEFVRHLCQGFKVQQGLEILPENTLVWSSEFVVWWSRRTSRRMYFRKNDEVPAGVSGGQFSQPALLWCVSGQELAVRALSMNRRPDADTPLMIAPFWNVDGSTGRVCLGSMRTPDIAGTAALAEWEKAFFESEFTHQTGARRLVQGAKGYFDVWEQVRGGRRSFPSSCLAPANETLSDLIRRCS
ncbi:MAG: PRTRC system protein B [Bryobacter sp.]|nr:PRTRC system protein B [Bryobacter sp.]